jgi:hypothetical protein
VVGEVLKALLRLLTHNSGVRRKAEDEERRVNEDGNNLRTMIYCLKILVRWTY